MDVGAFTSGLLTGLREGVEAALIVRHHLRLSRADRQRAPHPEDLPRGRHRRRALGLLGIGIYVTVGSFQEPYEQLFEAATLILAAGVVTWMLFWMRRQARNVKGELQAAVDRALDDGSAVALALLAFVAVIREGVETSLFLVGQAASVSAEGGQVWVVAGAVIGLLIAAVLGIGFYHGSRRLNLASFFRWTGVALVFIAAGLRRAMRSTS